MKVKPIDSATGREELTPREKEVLGLLAQGYSNKEIASYLFISKWTAKPHVSNILGKLQLISRTQAAVYALKILPPPDGTQPSRAYD
jgi:DNA-binding NarL/FixJ family response regulator